MSCPNNCVDGWIFNPYKKQKVECEYCKAKRVESVESGDAIEKLKLPKNYTNGRFVPETVFPEYMSKYLDESSVNEVKAHMKGLIDDIILGVLPKYSIMYNLGAKVIEGNFLNPLVLKGYIAGLKMTPIIDTATLCHIRNNFENNYQGEDDEIKFEELLSADLCVVSIDAGTSTKGVLAVKGLMQLRAKREKPTIILTHLWTKDIHNLCNEDSENFMYSLATLISVKYIKQVNSSPRAVMGMSKDEFTALQSPMNIL